MTDRPLRVALWCAVSTPEQAQVEKDSLRAQERDGYAWTEQLGGEVVAVLTVPGHSRRYLEYVDAERDIPAYRDLREFCTDRAFDVLWCRNRDRLGRSLALIATVDGLVQEAGAEVYSAAMPHQVGQQSSRSTTLLAAVEGWAAQAENVERTHRMRMGMAGRVRRGMLPNHPPTGYKPVLDASGDITSYTFDDHLPALRDITRLFLAGHSYNAIARQMNESGHPPPRGKRWYMSLVHKMLNSDVYAGYPEWGKTQYEGDEPSPYYPPLWDADEYQAILRERRRRDRTPYHRPGSGPYTGVAYCARCGERMTRSIRRYPDLVYYRCLTHTQASRGLAKPCHPNWLSQAKITDALAAYLRDLSTPELIDAALDEWTDDDQRGQMEAERDELERGLEELRRRRDRLALALSAGDMDSAIYRKTDDHLLDQGEALHSRLVEVDRALEAIPDRAYQRHILEHLARLFPHLVDHADPAELAKLLQDAELRVYCEEGEVVRVVRGENLPH